MSDNPRSTFPLNPQAVLGLLVVVAGLLLTADNLGMLESGRVLSFWPVGVLIVGGSMFLRATDTAARTWAAFITLAGGVWTVSRVLGWPVNFSIIFPLALVMVGVIIVQRAMGLRRDEPGTSDQQISDLAFWSGVERRVSSSLFRRADLTAVMGGVQLDFRTAAINGEAVIDLFAMMGGIEIRVPPDWAVSNQVIAIMGGVQDKSTGGNDSKHRLILRGFVMMGGVEIKT